LAWAAPRTVHYQNAVNADGTPHCDPLLIPQDVDEIGDPAFGFPADEALGHATTDVFQPVCIPTDDPSSLDALVRITNLTGRDLTEVWYVANNATRISNFDGWANDIGFPIDPNNDDVSGSSLNEANIFQKHYIGNGPIDIEYTIIPSGGVTEYTFIEGVFNDTGTTWTDYHMQLGFGLGTDFVPSSPGDDLDFDAPDFNSPFSLNPFLTVDVFEDDIDAYDGSIPDFTFVSPFVFTIDVPDGISTFTIRQFPTTDFIPEPSSMLLLLLGSAGCCTARRTRNRPMRVVRRGLTCAVRRTASETTGRIRNYRTRSRRIVRHAGQAQAAPPVDHPLSPT